MSAHSHDGSQDDDAQRNTPVRFLPSEDVIDRPMRNGPIFPLLWGSEVGPVNCVDVAWVPVPRTPVRVVANMADQRWPGRCWTLDGQRAENPKDIERWVVEAAHLLGSPWVTRRVIVPHDYIIRHTQLRPVELLNRIYRNAPAGDRPAPFAGEDASHLVALARARGFVHYQMLPLAPLRWFLSTPDWQALIRKDPSLDAQGVRNHPTKPIDLGRLGHIDPINIPLGDWNHAGGSPPMLTAGMKLERRNDR